MLPLLSHITLVPRPLDGEGPCAAAEEGTRAFGPPSRVDILLPVCRGELLGETSSSKDRKRLASTAPVSALGMASVLAAREIGRFVLVPSREPFLARTPANLPPPLDVLGSEGGGGVAVLPGVGGEPALKAESSRLVAGLGEAAAPSPARDEAVVGVDERFAPTATIVEAFPAMGMVFERTILTLAASAVPWRGAWCFGNSSTSLRFPSDVEDEKTRRVFSALRSLSFFLRMASFSSVFMMRTSKRPSSLISLLPAPLS